MAGGEAAGNIPAALRQLVGGSDETPLPLDALVRYQQIGLTPSREDDVRFVLHRDGRLFVATNAELPEDPTATLDAAVVAEVEGLLQSSQFASSPAYVGDEGIRDGNLVIVTARVGGDVHEVWYRNTSTELTDRLFPLAYEGAEGTSLDDLYATFVVDPAEEP